MGCKRPRQWDGGSCPSGSFLRSNPRGSHLRILVLTPLEDRLTDEERLSRLKSYNPYWTHVISYHEWVGHNVQRAIAEEHLERPMRRLYPFDLPESGLVSSVSRSSSRMRLLRGILDLIWRHSRPAWLVSR